MLKTTRELHLIAPTANHLNALATVATRDGDNWTFDEASAEWQAIVNRQQITVKITPPPEYIPPAPLAYKDWPKWAKLLSKRAIASDKGIGDIVQRYAAKVGGEQFKRFAKWMRLPCSCVERQAEWNILYPMSNGKGL